MDWESIPLKDALFMCFDLETTGINTDEDRIVQLAVSYFHGGQVIQQHSQIFNPQCPIPQQASEVHGIYDQDVINQPTFGEFVHKLEPHFRGQVLPHLPPPILLGYNIVSFDVPLFKSELLRVNQNESLIDIPMVDLIYFARWYLRNKQLKLVNLCEYFDVSLKHAHNALFDAKACGMLLPLFYSSGYLAETTGATIKQQTEFMKILEVEYQDYRSWLYRDRFTKELMLGQGKYNGVPLAKVDPGYLSYCLNNYKDIPELVKEAFSHQLNG